MQTEMHLWQHTVEAGFRANTWQACVDTIFNLVKNVQKDNTELSVIRIPNKWGFL